jgi:hypothetical protein
VRYEKSPEGFALCIPNDIIEGNGFYISYNNHDNDWYGSDTTALVVGQMEHFYILNGNHVANYLPLIEKGFNACFDYFEEHIERINKTSEYNDKNIVCDIYNRVIKRDLDRLNKKNL